MPAINCLQMSLEDSTHPHVLLRDGDTRGPDDTSVSDTVVHVGNGGIVVIPGVNFEWNSINESYGMYSSDGMGWD